jgi:uncharacterized protein
MKVLAGVLCSVLVLGAFSVAQDASSVGDQSSDQSIAGAAAASRARVQDQEAKRADIRRLLELTGAANMANQSMDGMESSVKALMSGSLPPGEYRDQLLDLFFQKFHAKRDTNQLIELVIPIYDKYYTHDDIKALIAFYETPVAKKMVAILPKVVQESQAAGLKWGGDLGRQCMLEVLAEHPELQRALLEAKKNGPPQ